MDYKIPKTKRPKKKDKAKEKYKKFGKYTQKSIRINEEHISKNKNDKKIAKK